MPVKTSVTAKKGIQSETFDEKSKLTSDIKGMRKEKNKSSIKKSDTPNNEVTRSIIIGTRKPLKETKESISSFSVDQHKKKKVSNDSKIARVSSKSEDTSKRSQLPKKSTKGKQLIDQTAAISAKPDSRRKRVSLTSPTSQKQEKPAKKKSINSLYQPAKKSGKRKGTKDSSRTSHSKEKNNSVSPAISPFKAEIPNKYHTSYLRALPRDPYYIYAYWEIANDLMSNLEREFSLDFLEKTTHILRVSYHSPHTESVEVFSHFDVEINQAATNWYIKIPQPGTAYTVQYGLKTPDGTFRSITSSNETKVPVNSQSRLSREIWHTPNTIDAISESDSVKQTTSCEPTLLFATVIKANHEQAAAKTDQEPYRFKDGSNNAVFSQSPNPILPTVNSIDPEQKSTAKDANFPVSDITRQISLLCTENVSEKTGVFWQNDSDFISESVKTDLCTEGDSEILFLGSSENIPEQSVPCSA